MAPGEASFGEASKGGGIFSGQSRGRLLSKGCKELTLRNRKRAARCLVRHLFSRGLRAAAHTCLHGTRTRAPHDTRMALARALAHERWLERLALTRVGAAASAARRGAASRGLSTAAPFTGRKARVAVLGCGGWTQGWHLPNLGNRADTEIVAVIDPCEHPGGGGCVPSLCKPMPEVAALYGARWFTSLEAVLAAKDELKLDGLLCAAPHALHHAIGTAVLEAGLHLLMEKPVTADVDEARQLYDLSLARPAQAFLVKALNPSPPNSEPCLNSNPELYS